MTTKQLAWCPNGERLLPLIRKITEPDKFGNREARCPACDRMVRIVFVRGTPQRPAPTGHYYHIHFAGGQDDD
jgi:hypothetical protein